MRWVERISLSIALCITAGTMLLDATLGGLFGYMLEMVTKNVVVEHIGGCLFAFGCWHVSTQILNWWSGHAPENYEEE